MGELYSDTVGVSNSRPLDPVWAPDDCLRDDLLASSRSADGGDGATENAGNDARLLMPQELQEKSELCRCNCGPTCGEQCGLPKLECIAQHWKRDCDHEFTGWVEGTTPEGAGWGSTVCKRCGLMAMAHDMRVGP